MSRGRGGTSREHYQRHLQFKENYHSSDPFPHYTRGSPQHGPAPAYSYNPPHPVVPPQPPAHSFLSSCPPGGNHSKDQIPPKPGESSCSNNPHNSFHYQQFEFLRGQHFKAPKFTSGAHSEEKLPARLHSPSYPLQPDYNRYPRPSFSPRAIGPYYPDQFLPRLRPSRVTPDSRLLTKNHLQGPERNPGRQQHAQTEGLVAAFHHFSLTQNWSKSGRDRVSRYSKSNNSASVQSAKVNITFTPDIQEQVHRALVALKPSDCVSAKLLAKKLHLPKTIVNKALYSLERTQKTFKQGLSPPLWTAYREQLESDKDQTSVVDRQCSPLTPKQKSDTDSSFSSQSWSVASSDSEDPRAEAESQHSITLRLPDQKHPLSKMPEQKELVLNHLYNSGETTALCIAKNLGFKTAKQINPTLYSLEKQGDVIKHGEFTPPTWELATHRRERMERSLKAAKSAVTGEDRMEGENEGGGSVLLSALTQLPTSNRDHLPLQDCWMPRQAHSEKVANILIFAADN